MPYAKKAFWEIYLWKQKNYSTLDRRLEKKMTEKKQIACTYFIYAMKWHFIWSLRKIKAIIRKIVFK